MIVVTGASGLVGGNIVRSLLAQGCSVRALVRRDRRALAGLDVELAEADVRDPASLQRAFSGAEVVYHLAGSISIAMDSWLEVEATNVMGTHNVVAACLESGVRRLVYFSSIQALQQGPRKMPVDEKRPLISGESAPPYDRSKAAAEREVRAGIEKGLDAIILNPTAIVGPYDFKPSYIGQAIIQLAQGSIPALVGGGFDWVDVRDVVTGAIRAEKLAPCGASYILSGNWHTVRDVANLVADWTGGRAPLFSVPAWLAYLAAPAMGLLAHLEGKTPLYTRVSLQALRSNPYISNARAVNELGYQPRFFRETVFDTLEWFEENGYLKMRRDAR